MSYKLPYHNEKYHVRRWEKIGSAWIFVEWDFTNYWKSKLAHRWKKHTSTLWLIWNFGFRWREKIKEVM